MSLNLDKITARTKSFVSIITNVLAVIYILSLNVSESFIVTSASPLQQCNKLPDVFELLLLRSIQLYIGIARSRAFVLYTSVLFTSPLQ